MSARRQEPNDEGTLVYRASKADCSACTLKSRCSPKTPMRRVPRSIHEAEETSPATSPRPPLSARRSNVPRPPQTSSSSTDCDCAAPCGAHDEFLLAATTQNLRKLAKLIPKATSSTQSTQSVPWTLPLNRPIANRQSPYPVRPTHRACRLLHLSRSRLLPAPRSALSRLVRGSISNIAD